MIALPLDVWHYILQFACSDGGRTGAVLSRVSQACRRDSSAYRFYSVQLHSLKQVEAFLATYKSAASAATGKDSSCDPPRVRHLLLTFLPGTVDVIVLGPCFHFRDYHSWSEVKAIWNARFVSTVTHLFELVAPRLETLTVLQSPEVLLPYVRVPGAFPALRTLVLFRNDGLFLRRPRTDKEDRDWMEPIDINGYGAGTHPDEAHLAAHPIFPALEQLYLANVECKPHLALWPLAAPRLVHLKVSPAEEESCAALRAALLRDGSAGFQALRTVDILPGPKVNHNADLSGLREATIDRPDLKLTVLEPLSPDFNDRRWVERLSREWTETEH